MFNGFITADSFHLECRTPDIVKNHGFVFFAGVVEHEELDMGAISRFEHVKAVFIGS